MAEVDINGNIVNDKTIGNIERENDIQKAIEIKNELANIGYKNLSTETDVKAHFDAALKNGKTSDVVLQEYIDNREKALEPIKEYYKASGKQLPNDDQLVQELITKKQELGQNATATYDTLSKHYTDLLSTKDVQQKEFKALQRLADEKGFTTDDEINSLVVNANNSEYGDSHLGKATYYEKEISKLKNEAIQAVINKNDYERHYLTREEAEKIVDAESNGNYTEYKNKIEEELQEIDPNGFHLKGENNDSKLHESKVTADKPNAVLSVDVPDNRDEFMWGTSTTKKGGIRTLGRGIDVVDIIDGKIVAKEGHEKDIEYEDDGKTIIKAIKTSNGPITKENTLASDHTMKEIIKATNGATYSDGTILQGIEKNSFGPLDPDKVSELSFLEKKAAVTATGQFLSDEWDKMYGAYVAAGWADYGRPSPEISLFTGTPLEQAYKRITEQGINADKLRQRFESRINSYKTQWEEMHSNIDGWIGAAADQEQARFELSEGLMDQLINHLTGTMEEAIAAFDRFMIDVDELKKAEDAINLKKSELEIAQAATISWKSHEPPKTHIVKEWNPSTKTVTYKEEDSEGWKTWNAKYQKLLDEENAIKLELDELRKKQEEWANKADADKTIWANFDESSTNSRRFFKRSGDNGEDGEYSSWFDSAENLLANYEDLKAQLENFSLFPVIDSMAKYEEGNILTFDDAHGERYMVVSAFDPFTGSIVIQHIGKDGNLDGNQVTIWDQREIWPVKNDHVHYNSSTTGDTTSKGEPEKKTTPKNNPTPPPSRRDNPDGDKTPPPTGGDKTPEGTTPETKPIPSGTIPTSPQTNIPTKDISVTTTPIIPGITPSTDPKYYAPHTGLDAVYTANNSADTSQSNSSLGALAGLAMGAAGLGLTGLIGDKDKDEKEKEEKVELSKEENSEELKEDNSIKQNENLQETEIKEFNNILEQK